MRTIATAACLFISAPIWGQLPPAGPERAKLLDQVLNKWEAAMTKVTSLEADCERTSEDKVFKTKEVYKGTVKFLKGDGPGIASRASLNLKNTTKPNVTEQLLLDGQVLYSVSPAAKEILVIELPKVPKMILVGDFEHRINNLTGLLFGMNAAQAKTRYKIDIAGADINYYYLRIESKSPSDRADFDYAQLALVRSTHLPRQLQIVQANGNQVTWDLPTIKTPADLRPADFAPPTLPPGWKMNRIPAAEPGPNKVRSSGG